MRVLIVDDNAAFLAAAGALLEREGLEVAGVAFTAAEALQQAEWLQPDVLLVDITLDGESGFEVARRLEHNPGCPGAVVLISTHAEDDFADLIAESPAVGFLPKSELGAAAILEIVNRES